METVFSVRLWIAFKLLNIATRIMPKHNGLKDTIRYYLWLAATDLLGEEDE